MIMTCLSLILKDEILVAMPVGSAGHSHFTDEEERPSS